MKEEIRLDKYLADMSYGTRKKLKNKIRKGQVEVNGTVIRKPEYKINIIKDRVFVNKEPVLFAKEEYYMLYKPAGVVSATKDQKEKTVLDLIKERTRKDLFPVGRLDKDTEGLLLLTNSGEIAHRMLSPKKHVDKIYYAKIQGNVTEGDRNAFLKGIDIGEKKKTLPADLKILRSGDISEVEITIREGKYHQIKRMFQARDQKVIYLKRTAFGPVVLDDRLKPGEYRSLTEKEISRIKEETE